MKRPIEGAGDCTPPCLRPAVLLVDFWSRRPTVNPSSLCLTVVALKWISTGQCCLSLVYKYLLTDTRVVTFAVNIWAVLSFSFQTHVPPSTFPIIHRHPNPTPTPPHPTPTPTGWGFAEFHDCWTLDDGVGLLLPFWSPPTPHPRTYPRHRHSSPSLCPLPLISVAVPVSPPLPPWTHKGHMPQVPSLSPRHDANVLAITYPCMTVCVLCMCSGQ